MNKVVTFSARLSMICAVAGCLWQTTAVGQEQQQEQAQPAAGQTSSSAPIEEVVVQGRFLSASEAVANERLQDPAVVDTLGADSISRLGDSTVAAALRRVPGLSLVSDKFVYVRGLGERYSQTTLNGAQIPSPDLTRNVIPLDVFPSSVVESLRVQKAWAPDLWANFGGGSVDIRTRGIPDEFNYSFEVGSGVNSATPSSVNTYPGGGKDNRGTDDGTRALSPAIAAALSTYHGDISAQNIALLNPSLTPADAQALNRSLALDLNRKIGLESKSPSPDEDLRASVGNTFQLNDKWDLGFLAGATYQNHWRGTTAKARNFNFPDQRTDVRDESLNSVDMSGNVNFGVHFTEDHEISTTSLFLRNTDDKTTIEDFHNENSEISSGSGFRDYLLRYEERNMRTNQIQGTHFLGDATRSMFPGLGKLLRRVPEETVIHWFSSQSKATTDIPNEVTVKSRTTTDPVTAAVLDEAVLAQTDAAAFRFTRLDDTVNSNGWSITWPIETAHSKIEIEAGSAHSEKARTYRQTELRLGPPTGTSLSVLQGPLDQVFSDTNITNTGFEFNSLQSATRSYLAATMTDAVFGTVDWTIRDMWRVTAGGRWEDYRQAAVPWNVYGTTAANPQVPTDTDTLKKATFSSDKVYPAVSFTYMGDWWADTFQLRFGASKTAVRPDLREIMDASYIDPITGDLTYGNSGVVPADVKNLDIRGEWFFASGDNFTATLFDKKIDNPIEFYEQPSSDTTIVREIGNAESAEVKGIEIEGLKRLGFIGPRWSPFFIQGNLTSQDSELIAGQGVNSVVVRKRQMVGASKYVANLMFGYDSPNMKHTASLIYNVFGERLYVPGDLPGHPDAFEQPFNSLDFTYSWYPSDTLTFKAKAQNLLGDKIEIERSGVQTYELDPGRNFALSVQWGF
jgi:TonB-dependent receptor